MLKKILKSQKVFRERSAGVIIFYREENEPLYLILHYPKAGHRAGLKSSGHWDFPKGHIEKNEKIEEAALREVTEETGLKNITLLPTFKEKMNYFYKLHGNLFFKEVIFFLGESNSKKVKLSYEHLGYKWLPYKEALEILTFPNAKNIFRKANRFLKNKFKFEVNNE